MNLWMQHHYLHHGQPGDKKADKTKKDDKAKDDKAKPGDSAAKPEDKPADAKPAEPDLADDADSDTPSILAPEKGTRSATGSAEFRDDRWVELYTKKIEEMIAVLKTKGVPVLWVGLPAVRGTMVVQPVHVTVLVRPCSTRNMMMNTGICSSSGKHEAKGFTLCSWYSFIISSLSFCRSLRYWFCSRFISGCSFCISSMPLVLFSTNGAVISITTNAISEIARM